MAPRHRCRRLPESGPAGLRAPERGPGQATQPNLRKMIGRVASNSNRRQLFLPPAHAVACTSAAARLSRAQYVGSSGGAAAGPAGCAGLRQKGHMHRAQRSFCSWPLPCSSIDPGFCLLPAPRPEGASLPGPCTRLRGALERPSPLDLGGQGSCALLARFTLSGSISQVHSHHHSRCRYCCFSPCHCRCYPPTVSTAITVTIPATPHTAATNATPRQRPEHPECLGRSFCAAWSCADTPRTRAGRTHGCTSRLVGFVRASRYRCDVALFFGRSG